MTISEAYDAQMQEALEAGLTIEEAKEHIDATEEAEFRVEAQNGIGDHFCFYGINSNNYTIANVWESAGPQQKQLQLAKLFAAAPEMLKALRAVYDAGFDCNTDLQWATLDQVINALTKADNLAE